MEIIFIKVHVIYVLLGLMVAGIIFGISSILLNPLRRKNLKKSIGNIGTIVECIPKGGKGKISAIVAGGSSHVPATSSEHLSMGTKVKIISLNKKNIFVVSKV
jgi:hypothetical protein